MSKFAKGLAVMVLLFVAWALSAWGLLSILECIGFLKFAGFCS